MLGPNVFIKRRVSKAGAIVALVMSGDAPDAGTPDEHGRCEAQHELKRKFLGAHGFNFFLLLVSRAFMQGFVSFLSTRFATVIFLESSDEEPVTQMRPGKKHFEGQSTEPDFPHPGSTTAGHRIGPKTRCCV